jgi:flavin-dependent dehydrogenase
MAVILDSKKVYSHYERILKDKIVLDCEVKGIEKKQDGFLINTSKGNYGSEILVDASGVSNVSDYFFNNGWFRQAAYFTCYGKRFSNCNIPKDAPSFFDFESPELFGTWCYPVNNDTLELGVSRYSKKIEVESNKDELEILLEKYCKLSPFNEYLKGSTPGEVVKGNIPLLPRPYNINNGVIFIGDAKGTCYSGQGLFNALYSAKAAADYLLNGKDYEYSVCQPLRNIGFLNMVSQLNAQEFRILFKNITKFSGNDLFKFLTGTIDNEFMVHALKSTPKELRSVIARITDKSMLLRSFFNGKPKKSDYNIWYKE